LVKKGAQPGNTNALKHGFYSGQFQDGEIADLDVLLADGLQDEINMMRVMTRRLLKLADGEDTMAEQANILGVLGLASTRLAGLLRTQRVLSGESSEVKSAISQALSEIVEEMKIS